MTGDIIFKTEAIIWLYLNISIYPLPEIITAMAVTVFEEIPSIKCVINLAGNLVFGTKT